ncbi:MAG: ATP-binding protein [Mobilitalea sp.]
MARNKTGIYGNAVFHKSYRDGEPVEIRIYVDNIQIINYPGPDKWIDMDKFVIGKVRARKYRNRRIGEFFKEIELSEKQGTGITTILSELKKNGSPLPEFETDDDRTYLITTIKMRSGFEHKHRLR